MNSSDARREIVQRHNVVFTDQHPTNVLSVGNGNIAITVDATGLQTFPDLHELREDPLRVVGDGLDGLPEQVERPFDRDDYQIPLRIQSTWGWYSTVGSRTFSMAEAETDYDTARGPVPYPDQMGLLRPEDGIPHEIEAAAWLSLNPRRLNLGRLALHLPEELMEHHSLASFHLIKQELDLWTGTIDSLFTLGEVEVRVQTIAHPTSDTLGVQIESDLVEAGLGVEWRFDDQKDSLMESERLLPALTSWSRSDSSVSAHREIGGATYDVAVTVDDGSVTVGDDEEAAVVDARGERLLKVTLALTPEGRNPLDAPVAFDRVREDSTAWWSEYWSEGLMVDFAASADPRAEELERRVVLSQYLLVVNSAGATPPQETGLVYNSWGGKFHLEMHWWHAAHFAMWRRPALLGRSLEWYRSALPAARATAARQGMKGARWPKQTDVSARESPSVIGVFLIWQQPHIIHLLELLHEATGSGELIREYADLVFATAEFMADFAERRGDRYVLPAPLIPAQESYLTTRDKLENPTFELAYWQWGLNVAAEWKRRLGEPVPDAWLDVANGLTEPTILNDGGYAAIATPPQLIREDHWSTLMAYGFVPPTPLIDPAIMAVTLEHVLEKWDMQSTWGWDYPVLAMTAVALGDLETAIESLLTDTPKNRFLANGHNPQMPGFLSLYLPGNGALLAAVAHIAGAVSAEVDPPAGWKIRVHGNPALLGPALRSTAQQSR